MLILTRRIGETIIINDNEIRFTVLGINGYQVRIGIDADKKVIIHREEVYNRIQAEKAKDEPEWIEEETEQETTKEETK